MKKVLVCTLSAMMLLCSFSLKNLFGGGSSSSSSQPAATTTTTAPVVVTSNDGVSAGKALRTLYTNYKAAGKFDYSNLNNIISTITLVNSCKNLKANMADNTYWSGFAQGLVSGSENLVTDQISNTVTTQLSNIVSQVDTEKLESAADKLAATKTVANDLTTLFQMFK